MFRLRLYYLRKREKKRASATQWQMVTVLLTDAGMSNTPAFSNAPIKGTVRKTLALRRA